MYKIRPSVAQGLFTRVETQPDVDMSTLVVDPNQLRWRPFSLPAEGSSVNFVQGMHLICGSGDPFSKTGMAVYYYSCNASMGKTSFYDSDGDMLIVPQLGALNVKTEMGRLRVEPCEIMVVPRGIKFSVDVEGLSRGYISEVLKGHFEIPSLGPIGANGLANPRDFLIPVAHFEDDDSEHVMMNKFGGVLFEAKLSHSPFDVVAWHGEASSS